MGKYSREKGKRGELDIVHRLGGKRVGVAYLKNPVDVDLGWAVLQVKNKTMGGSAMLTAIEEMVRVTEASVDKYVMFKAKRGQWLVVETIEQFMENHVGSKVMEEGGQNESRTEIETIRDRVLADRITEEDIDDLHAHRFRKRPERP